VKSRSLAAAATLAILLPTAAAAAETPSPAAAATASTPAAAAGAGDGWRHEVAIYLAGVGMSGKAAIGNVGADVDISFSEILDQLEAGGMAAYRGERGKWAIMANAMFVGLGATKDLRLGGTAEADFDQTLFEVDGSRRFAKGLEFYFGARLVDIDASLELRLINGTTLAGDERQTWVDPLIGLRWETPMGPKWSFVGRADVGGFGVGSHLAWQAMAHFDWAISKHCGLAVGYVVLDIDYDDGQGSDYFLYDIAAQGPIAAATFTF
jgi:hypothetical protein